MATTKDRLDELTRHERELGDHDVVALEDGGIADAEVPPAAAGNESKTRALHTALWRRVLEPITGRWAAIGAVAWVALLGIGLAVEPPPTNPNAADPWFLDALGVVLLAAVVSAFAGFWLRRRWSMASSLVASGLLVVFTVVGRPARLRARAGNDQHPWTAAGLKRARRNDRLPVWPRVKAVRAVLGRKFETRCGPARASLQPGI